METAHRRADIAAAWKLSQKRRLQLEFITCCLSVYQSCLPKSLRKMQEEETVYKKGVASQVHNQQHLTLVHLLGVHTCLGKLAQAVDIRQFSGEVPMEAYVAASQRASGHCCDV